MDIAEIPDNELVTDYFESYKDIAYCKIAKEFGFEMDTSGNKLDDRIMINQKIIEITKKEIMSRNISLLEISVLAYPERIQDFV